MDAQSRSALREALTRDEALKDRFAAARTEADVIALAREAGIDLDAATAGEQLSDRELETVSGGYTFPPTDWIYCDNPWTNVWCTLRC